ncbi:hypothetical protein HN446_01980 [bacterium]|nr:hypothetical protein [bacterium]
MKKLLLSFLFCLNCVFGCFAADGALESKDDAALESKDDAAPVAGGVEKLFRFIPKEGLDEVVEVPEAVLRRLKHLDRDLLSDSVDEIADVQDGVVSYKLSTVDAPSLRAAVHFMTVLYSEETGPDREGIFHFIDDENHLSIEQRIGLFTALEFLRIEDIANIVLDSIVLLAYDGEARRCCGGGRYGDEECSTFSRIGRPKCMSEGVCKPGLQALLEYGRRLPSIIRVQLEKSVNVLLLGLKAFKVETALNDWDQ